MKKVLITTIKRMWDLFCRFMASATYDAVQARKDQEYLEKAARDAKEKRRRDRYYHNL